MAKRESKLQLVLESLPKSEVFSIREATERCSGLTKKFVSDTLKQLVDDGFLKADQMEDQVAYVWKTQPDEAALLTWVQRQVRGSQVTQTPLHERPREKLLRDGVASLTNAELLAIMIRVGIRGESAIDSGRKIANFFANAFPQLRTRSFAELKQISKAINSASYAQIMAGVELGRRLADIESRERRDHTKITGTASAVEYCLETFRFLAHEGVQEEFSYRNA